MTSWLICFSASALAAVAALITVSSHSPPKIVSVSLPDSEYERSAYRRSGLST